MASQDIKSVRDKDTSALKDELSSLKKEQFNLRFQKATGQLTHTDRQRQVIVAEAYRDSQKIKGEGDAEAARMYADAFGRDPQFAQFYRSLDAYKASFNKKSDVMVVDPSSSEFFRTFRNGGNAAATAPAAKK